MHRSRCQKIWVLQCNVLSFKDLQFCIQDLFQHYRSSTYKVTFFQKIPAFGDQFSCSKWSQSGKPKVSYLIPDHLSPAVALPVERSNQKKLNHDLQYNYKVSFYWQILQDATSTQATDIQAFYLIAFRTAISAASLAFLTRCSIYDPQEFRETSSMYPNCFNLSNQQEPIQEPEEFCKKVWISDFEGSRNVSSPLDVSKQSSLPFDELFNNKQPPFVSLFTTSSQCCCLLQKAVSIPSRADSPKYESMHSDTQINDINSSYIGEQTQECNSFLFGDLDYEWTKFS